MLLASERERMGKLLLESDLSNGVVGPFVELVADFAVGLGDVVVVDV